MQAVTAEMEIEIDPTEQKRSEKVRSETISQNDVGEDRAVNIQPRINHGRKGYH